MERIELSQISNVISQIGAIVRQGGLINSIGAFQSFVTIHGAAEQTQFAYTQANQQAMQLLSAQYPNGINTAMTLQPDGSYRNEPLPSSEAFNFVEGLRQAILYASGQNPQLDRSGQIMVTNFVIGEPLQMVVDRPQPTYGITPVVSDTAPTFERYRLIFEGISPLFGGISQWVIQKIYDLLKPRGWDLNGISQSNGNIEIEVTKEGSVTLFVVAGIIAGVLALIGWVTTKWSAVRLSDNVTEQTKQVTNAETDLISQVLGSDIPTNEKTELIGAIRQAYQLPTQQDSNLWENILGGSAGGLLAVGVLFALMKD